MLKGIGQLFLGPDGGADEMALAAVLGVLVYLGISIYAYCVHGQPWDPQAFGIGLGAVIAGAASGMGLKAVGERKGRDDNGQHS